MYGFLFDQTYINLIILGFFLFLIMFLWRKITIIEGNYFILEKRVDMFKKTEREHLISKNIENHLNLSQYTQFYIRLKVSKNIQSLKTSHQCFYQAVWAPRRSRASDSVVCWCVWVSPGKWKTAQQSSGFWYASHSTRVAVSTAWSCAPRSGGI